jgi:uncharacterized protein (TIGR00369 family)
MTRNPGKKKIFNPYTKVEGYNCFGCSPRNQFGLQLQFYEEGDFLMADWVPKDHFSGYNKVLHGGIQSTLLDEIASWAVQIKLKTAGVTAGIDLRFKKPVFVDQGILKLRAHIARVEKRIAFVETELLNANGEICCTGVVKYYIFPEDIARKQLNFPGIENFFQSY